MIVQLLAILVLTEKLPLTGSITPGKKFSFDNVTRKFHTGSSIRIIDKTGVTLDIVLCTCCQKKSRFVVINN